MSLPTITNRANFNEEVLASKVPVVVCFYKKSSGSSEIIKSEVENKERLPLHLLDAVD